MKFSLLLLSLVGLGNAIELPKPNGPYSVAVRTSAMIDKHRIDPYDPRRGHRNVLASIFWPVPSPSCSKTTLPYMTPAVAKLYGQKAQSMGLSNETFAAFEYSVCTPLHTPKGCGSKRQFPLIIFSPGAGNSRLLYSNMARSFASFGNIVALIDHPYDADIIEFPDGKTIMTGNIPETTKSLIKLTKVRAEDISFVISEVLQSSLYKSVLKGLPGSVDKSKIVALGHSLGGASAAVAILSDKRICGGMDMDGQIFDPALSQGLEKPFFLVGRPNHSKEDATWNKFFANLRGSKKMITIDRTVHGSFTDYPQLIQALNLPASASKAIQPLIGTVNPSDLENGLSKIVVSFVKACSNI
ncbi:uncharacterized protein FIESC28_08625 [Fusarium coffeatum]|uniref:1-alkyl-2-acetylglycerophosphocholine esterase n=1 Tax=Fusarium coffeatum TaxID=231269 RepID=A0A366R5S2_9HYPO|nr:uncharacterized protein FIESC28_08625 [Fusarium coffeatum]RBR12501.1 hypothetical protein FIESC28_08625 [Fusarium coffeatum]